MIGGGRSLLDFLDAPVVVGDPEGQAVYANPAFQQRFSSGGGEALLGRPLATLFEGGAREAVLEAIAKVCDSGRPLRFRVRERGLGFAALASPIAEGEARFGVLLLLSEESLAEDRLLAYQREIQEPLDKLGGILEELFEQTGGRRAERFRDRVEHALRALDRARKWTEALSTESSGRAPASGGTKRFDPAQAVRNAASAAGGDTSQTLELLVPAELPQVRGDGARFEATLASLLRERLERSSAGTFTVAAKAAARGAHPAVLVTITESADGGSDDLPLPSLLADMIEAIGGTIHTTSDPVLGRTLAIRLPFAG